MTTLPAMTLEAEMSNRFAIGRRNFLGVTGGGVLLGSALRRRSQRGAEGSDSLAAGAPDGHARTALLHQGTDLAIALSPDRRTIAMDAVGTLWTLPVQGGTARPLTDTFADVARPAWSPDGSMITFQSYRDGNFNIWTARPDGTAARELTEGPYDHREPQFSPDGQSIAFSSDLSGSYGIYTLDLASGKVAAWADTGAEEYEPAWAPDGKRIAFVADSTSIVVADASGGRATIATAPAGAQLHAPTWSPDGTAVYYTQIANGMSHLMRDGQPVFTGEEVFPFAISWISADEFLYTASGEIRRRSLSSGAAETIPFSAEVATVTPAYRKRRRDFDSTKPVQVRGIGSPVLSPDTGSVAFRALNDIWTVRIGHRPVPLTNDHFWKSDPAWSPDGRWLSYSSDRGGKLDIWLRDLRSGADTQLTNLDGAAAVSATWSRDGGHLAFLDQAGNVYTVEVATGSVRKVFGPLWEPSKPTWSADGNTLALAAIKPYSAHYREGVSQILLINITTGVATYVEPMPHRSIGTRGDDGPVWSPDGRWMAFVVGSVLWIMPVAPDGTPAGQPRQITSEVTDAPTWSGDSSQLLYLSNGRLRLVSVADGRTRTVPVPLAWSNAKPAGRKVIHAGALWDGATPAIQRDVDIIVEGNKIAAIEGHRAGRSGEFIDASGSMVIPGLIDMHNHREMQGYSYGDRQGRLWLSLGITTTRSPGSPAYHMVEERESLQSGARVGPRYFATGEAIDGSRIYYNFMRPVVDDAQLALELERAEALDYDLVKCYVRLPVKWQAYVIDWAHRHHIHATSHYHFPAFALGGDGMEHVGATNRLGYSRTFTGQGAGFGIGAAYQDCITLFNTSGAVRTPTLFVSMTLFREDTSLVTDRRVTTLYPSWEYASLQASVTSAKTTDQTANRICLANQVAQLVAMQRGGGRVMTGTDSPIDHTAVSTHMNMRAMVKYGMTPYEVLVTATRTPGEFLQEPIGQVRPGYYADLVAVDGNPLARIEDAAAVRMVMTGGVPYTVDQLLEPFLAASPQASASPMLAAAPDPPANRRYWWHDPHYIEAGRRSCCVMG
jgi:Tol biopolymer transport system component